MTEKSEKQKRCEQALEFRLSFQDHFNKLHDYFNDCYEPTDLKSECSEKLKELNQAWSKLVVFYLTEWEISEGIIKVYHPLNRMPEAMGNAQKKLQEKIDSLEKEVERLKGIK